MAISSRQNTLTVHGVKCWLRDDASPETARRVLEPTLEKFFRGELTNLYVGRRKEKYRFIGDDGVTYLLKVNRYPWFSGLCRSLRPSRARHELLVAQGIAQRGLPTPVPLAAGELRRNGMLCQCFQWMPVLDNVCDLETLWKQREIVSPAEWRAIVTALGKLSRATVKAKIFQDDFAPNNLLVRRGTNPELFLIDFERAELRSTHLSDTEERLMLAKLHRYLADASATDRMRFLHAYCEDDRDQARRRWQELRTFSSVLAARDFARMQRKSADAGRRCAAVCIAEWTGFAVQSRLNRAAVETFLARRSPTESSQPAESHTEEFWSIRYENLRAAEAHAIWSAANTLEVYGRLAPSPVALLKRGTTTVLLFQKTNASITLPDAADSPDAGAAARVLIDRLLALGNLQRELEPSAIALELRRQYAKSPHAALKALVLDLRAFRFAAKPDSAKSKSALVTHKAKQFCSLKIQSAAHDRHVEE